MIDVVSVKPLGDFRLRVAFSNGSAGIHDFSSTVLHDGEMVQPLKDSIALYDCMRAAGELTQLVE
jgi:hypothetical protein